MNLPGLDYLAEDEGMMVEQDLAQGVGRLYDPHRYRREQDEAGPNSTGMAMAMLMERGGRSRRRGGGGGLMQRIENTYDPNFDHEVLFGPGVAGHEKHLHAAAPTGLKGLGRALEKRGFDVGEHGAFGGVAGVHTEGSHHYNNDALDINYNGGGRWDTETQALRWLKRKLRAVYGEDAYYG